MNKFLETMTGGSSAEQLAATKNASGVTINYLGVCMFGKTSELKEITGKLSLFGK